MRTAAINGNAAFPGQLSFRTIRHSIPKQAASAAAKRRNEPLHQVLNLFDAAAGGNGSGSKRENRQSLSFGVGAEVAVRRQPSEALCHHLVSPPLQLPSSPSSGPPGVRSACVISSCPSAISPSLKASIAFLLCANWTLSFAATSFRDGLAPGSILIYTRPSRKVRPRQLNTIR